MPIFEYICKGCGKEVEVFVRNGEAIVCPQCSSDQLEKLLSAPAGHVAEGGSLPIMGNACPPPSAGPCSPHCCRLPG